MLPAARGMNGKEQRLLKDAITSLYTSEVVKVEVGVTKQGAYICFVT